MTTQLTLEGVGPTVIDIPLTQPDFHIDVTIQQRVALDAATVADYAELYPQGRDLGRITVFADEAAGCYWLSDGFHRCAAAQQAGLRTLPAEVHNGGRREALLFATSANLHGKPLTNADKRKRVRTLLNDPEWRLWSDNHIAQHCGVAHSFVGKLRDQLSLDSESSEHRDNEPNQPTTRQYINKHGQQVTMQVEGIGGHHNSSVKCLNCGKSLSDPTSSQRGIGPVCACSPHATAAGRASEQATLEPAQSQASTAPQVGQSDPHAVKQARNAAEDRAARQSRACAEAVQYLGELATDYGLEVVETQILAVFLAAQGRPTPASHVPQAVDPGVIPAEVRQTIPTAPRQAPQTGLAARVRATLPTYGLQGTTAGALAKVLGVSHDKTWRNLERLVKQGKARKEGVSGHCQYATALHGQCRGRMASNTSIRTTLRRCTVGKLSANC
jgi:hypothetical protein